MILFDVNILIYAHREDQKQHASIINQFQKRIQNAPSFGFSPSIVGAYLRIVTQPKFPNGPTPLSQALAHIDHLVYQPNFSWAAPGSSHWELMSSLCRNTQTSGKRVADAQHAAVAIEHAATFISADSDFHSFKAHGLRFEHWAAS